MPPEDMKKRLRKQPFEPFRIYLSDGAFYDVRHPELVMLGHRSLVLGLTSTPEDTFYERTLDVDLLHIVRMEKVPPDSTRKNGGPKKGK